VPTHVSRIALPVVAIALLFAASADRALGRAATHHQRHAVRVSHKTRHARRRAAAKRHATKHAKAARPKTTRHAGATCAKASRRSRHRARAADCRRQRHRSAGSAPSNTLAPSLAGTPVQGHTLSVSPGTWSGSQPIRYSFQWLRDGVAVGSGGSSYALTGADVGHRIGVLVSASNEDGMSSAASGYSAPVGQAPAPPPPPPTTLGEPPILEAGTGNSAPATPSGPASPAGGWHVAFADAFAKPIVGGEDSFWHAEERNNGCCSNSNEYGVERARQAKVGPEGLQLTCTMPGAECAGVDTPAAPHPFRWTPGGGVTWAVECMCKWPVNTDEADPGFWTWAPQQEIDFFEGWGWGHAEYMAGIPVVVGSWDNELYSEAAIGFNPAAAFHHYTTEFVPVGASYEMREYLDGALRFTKVVTLASVPQELRLTYGLRHDSGQVASGFTSGSRSFDARYVTLYQDAAHAGVNVTGGGIAPGTALGWSSGAPTSRSAG
jgi:hypothetical protein